ncbi:MAG: RsiV family protein, partial [Pseudomonadota bacterium]|nr:RsiV family protein [Pseudomonadota bacterium]
AFPQAPALSEALQTRLLTLGMAISDETAAPAESWDAYAERFLSLAEEDNQAAPGDMTSEALLEATVYARHHDLLVIELNSYVYHAGQAHGLPLTEYMVIDERERRIVEPEDMLVDGQEAAFDALLAGAHQRWITEMGLDAQFATQWPLSKSRNIAPLEDRWEVTYNVYDIAPYAAGQPTLTLPLEALKGVAKPRYLGQ